MTSTLLLARSLIGENDSPLKLSVMADVGRCDYKKDILPKEDSVIDLDFSSINYKISVTGKQYHALNC